ncbi:MAG: hypothetical protein ACOYNC_16500 [Bacteroidales bacterium]
MKTNTRTSILLALLPVFFLLLLTVSCKKVSDTTYPAPTDSEFLLKGSVINAVTHTGVANAKVYFGASTILTTDANGVYQFNCKTVEAGTYNVWVKAAGYAYGMVSATVASDAAMVNTIMLNPLSAPVTVGSAGGTVTVADPESLTPGASTTLTIPSGTFSENINVTLSRFTGIEVPMRAWGNMLNACTVNIGPEGTVCQKPVTLRFALPFADPTVNEIPVILYNLKPDGFSGVTTGLFAQVDHATNTATVEVSNFGTYCLGVDGSYQESNGTAGTVITVPLDRTLSSVDFAYQASNNYPGGTPSTISLAWLKNLASQNTVLNGERVSFTSLTTFTFNYIGSKPDSLAPVKNSGYYRWNPKVSYATVQMPMTTNIHGVSVSGIIEKQVYAPASGYDYVHDQGGGGK